MRLAWTIKWIFTLVNIFYFLYIMKEEVISFLFVCWENFLLFWNSEKCRIDVLKKWFFKSRKKNLEILVVPHSATNNVTIPEVFFVKKRWEKKNWRHARWLIRRIFWPKHWLFWGQRNDVRTFRASYWLQWPTHWLT